MPASPYPPELLERHEQTGVQEADSGGRSPFARDRDRILYSSAFRALGGKTQVVASTELGFLHNRLTHSLKVAQIGRSLARRLHSNGARLDADLVEAACLAHDIGHPPFGHAGEEALDAAIEQRRRDDLALENAERSTRGTPEVQAPAVWDGFEGNAQNLRVLTRLATHRLWTSPGLHLTRATLLASTKYPWRRDPGKKQGRKWGAYEADAGTLAWITAHSPDDALPIEEQIMDWADDVTYAVHDVEDWYRLGSIPLHALFRFDMAADHPRAGTDENPTLSRFLDWVEAKWSQLGKPFDRPEVVKALHQLSDRIAVEEPFYGERVSKGRIQATVTDLICFFTDPVSFDGEGWGYEGTLVVPDDRRLLCDLLKELVWHYVIGSSGLAAQQHGQGRIVRDLVLWCHEDPGRLLPPDRQEEARTHGDATRAIADHVASLTEPMATNLHGKLAGTALGAITDTV